MTMMKKSMLTWLIGGLLLSNCGTYTGEGAATGAAFGSILGSAIGGISGGWRGHDIGTIVGMAGGAVVGAAIGSAADEQEKRKYEEYQQQRSRRYDYDNDYQVRSQGSYSDGSGFDATNSGDDRISFDGAGPQVQAVEIEIRNARIIDADRDGIIRAGEESRVTFEIMNRSAVTLFDVQPIVLDVTGNKHIHISPNLHVESIAPNQGIRYTASIMADKKLKDGEAVIRVGVAQGKNEITSQFKEFSLQTRRR